MVLVVEKYYIILLKLENTNMQEVVVYYPMFKDNIINVMHRITWC